MDDFSRSAESSTIVVQSVVSIVDRYHGVSCHQGHCKNVPILPIAHCGYAIDFRRNSQMLHIRTILHRESVSPLSATLGTSPKMLVNVNEFIKQQSRSIMLDILLGH
jgi:hypothetical protein